MSHAAGMFSPLSVSGAVLALGTAFVACAAFVDEYKSGFNWPEPKGIDPGPVGGPPSDAIVLFDGKDLSQWNDGAKREIKDGDAVARESGITTKESVGDRQMDDEWATPAGVSQ